MNIYIIGIGLIGGSFALSMRNLGLATKIYASDKSQKNVDKALELGIIDEVVELDRGVECADLIVITTPVNTVPMMAIKVLNRVRPDQVVIDMGSIKEELCEAISLHANRARFVATHPMWGTENSGPQSAVSTGFKGRTMVICEAEQSDPMAVELIEKIFTTIGMPIVKMNAEEHDLHVAYISHISHVTSYALALTVLEKEREEQRIFDLAGGGFESTVRLAKSSVDMWLPIFMHNKYNLLDVLREHIHQLQVMRKAIEADDIETLHTMIARANTIRDIIK
ncbi:MAG: prephenate dehydrogenase [Rikenellaceae bacterium]